MKVTTCVLLFLCTINVFAHGDLHERIQKVTTEIESDRDNHELYITRGELYAQHENYKLALKDFKKAEKLAGTNGDLQLNFAKSYFRLGKEKTALEYLERILEQDQDHVIAWRLKGQCLANLNEYQAAGLAFQNVITYSVQTLPENYFEAALMFEKAEVQKLDKAIETIEQGIEDLGKVVSLEQKLIQLYVQHGDYQKAIGQLTDQLETRNRKEFILFERGKIYALSLDKTSAENDFKSALQLIDKLPSRLKNTAATKNLIKDINQQLDFLNK